MSRTASPRARSTDPAVPRRNGQPRVLSRGDLRLLVLALIGEQPRLRPGEDFHYTSGVMLGTDHGTMQGHYDMVADDGTEFAAPVAPFVLAVPRTLH